jgi:hypothetical protein
VKSKPKRRYRENTDDWGPIVPMENLQVSLDGGITWVYAKNIRVIASDREVDGEVRLDITNEGVKTEVVCDEIVTGAKTAYFFDTILKLEASRSHGPR